MPKKFFTIERFKTEEEAKDYIKRRRLRKYLFGYSENLKCFVVTHNIYI